MKKLTLLLLAAGIAGNASALDPKKENVGMIGKISATWCFPCGNWGWTLMNDLIAANATSFPISIFASSSENGGSWKNLEFYNADNLALAQKVTYNGYPSFSANLKDWSLKNTNPDNTINTAGIKADVNASLAAFASAPVVASAAYTYSISGNTLTVQTTTKFWAAATGNYNVAVYLTENAKHIQNGQTGVVSHHGVFRAPFNNKLWGESIVSGSATAGQTFDQTFTYTLTGDGLTKWDKTLFNPIVIIYKQNGSGYEFVNANEHGTFKWTSGVENMTSMTNLAIYPNPAIDKTNIAFALQNAAPVTITVTDIMGRNVFTSGTLQFNAGQNNYELATANYPAGVYNVTMRSNETILTERISVAK